MSWITCDGCGAFINSDNDPECFQEEVGGLIEYVLCEACRDSTLPMREKGVQDEQT